MSGRLNDKLGRAHRSVVGLKFEGGGGTDE